MNKYKKSHKKKGNKKKVNNKKGNKKNYNKTKFIQKQNNIQKQINIDNTNINLTLKELPDLVTRKIWKYRLNYVFNDIKNKNHKLLKIYKQDYIPRFQISRNGDFFINKWLSADIIM